MAVRELTLATSSGYQWLALETKTPLKKKTDFIVRAYLIITIERPMTTWVSIATHNQTRGANLAVHLSNVLRNVCRVSYAINVTHCFVFKEIPKIAIMIGPTEISTILIHKVFLNIQFLPLNLLTYNISP